MLAGTLTRKISSTQKANLIEENLHCHHILFIQDVKNAVYDSDGDTFFLETTQLLFKKAKLNGIIVAQKTLVLDNNVEQYTIWLDDGTSVIKVIIPKPLLKRNNAEYLIESYNVTLFGKVQHDKENVLICGGFFIEDNDAAELHHWIRALQDRPADTLNSAPLITKSKYQFHTLSSLPSPNRITREKFLASPIREENNQKFAWSPDHAFATSTPMRAVQESPLRFRTMRLSTITTTKIEEEEEDEFGDDEFGDFGSMDLINLENQAVLMNQGEKRKFDLANME